MSTDFNVAKLVRHVIDTTSLSDPREIAQKVAGMVPRERRQSAIEQMLPVYVTQVASRDRMLHQVKPQQKGSSKVQAVRDDWKRRLATPLLVGDAWKRFGECTAADLLAVAETLRTTADRTLQKASYYEEIAAALPDGAQVSSLPSDPTGRAA